MIVRIWHGRVLTDKAAAYAQFLKERAIPDYRSVPGNVEAMVVQRRDGGITHFLTITRWESMDSILGFTGPDTALAKYYPEDQEFLIELEPHVLHYEVVGQA